MSGFCRNVREEQNQGIKDCMLDYVINLLDDAQDFSWSSAKASHAVLLCRMEQGKIGGWSEVEEKIDRVQRAHAQHHGTPQAVQNVKNYDKNQKFPAKFTLCVYLTRMRVDKRKIIRIGAFCTGTFALLVGNWMVRHMLTLSWTAGEPVQKTSKYGHVEPKGSPCPEI